ncbi:kinase-like domain-containing protein [Rhizophagus clarus]|uniref:Kinase-like domain-containing protein n=1 Tax=Rhizophagus clarus TaxID=94130 RepID=A0A8H3KUZ4_9GLOM|nr:kinase-like domain-containing protein [Rhizophagus clarus]
MDKILARIFQTKKKPKDLWKDNVGGNQVHVTVSTIDSTKSEVEVETIVYIGDLEKRKKAYGICGECKEPGGFGKIYSAELPEGVIDNWDIKNKKWSRFKYRKYALKSLKNSFDICSDFLNEIKSHIQIYLNYTVRCYGITQDPNTKEYMMVLSYYRKGNLRNYLNISKSYMDYKSKINDLQKIARGLLNIHNSGFIHKDFHSGNILFGYYPFISDLGMCRPANKQTVKEEGIYGVLPYMAPEVLRGHQYTKAADIYSFGTIMNEFLSEEIPYNDIPHNEFLAIKICKGDRPKISKDVPKLLADLIIKCWDAEIENRPTAKELCQILIKWNDEIKNRSGEIYSQVEECDKIGRKKFISRSNDDKSKIIRTHPQAIYTSRLLNYKNLPNPVNSSDLTSFQFNSDKNYTIQSTLVNPISECLDVQLSELELNEICQDDESNTR